MGGLKVEIAPPRDLDTEESRALTERIKSAVGDLMMLVARAWQGRVWIALGYKSWPDYIKGEFDHAPLALPRDERQAVVALLRGQGMSQRTIGSAVGVDRQTVANDLAGGEFSPPVSELAPVIGLDGKSYSSTPAAPPTPRRGPITDDFGRAVSELTRVANRIARIGDDDRFGRNQEALSNRASDLTRAVQAIVPVLAQLLRGQGNSLDDELAQLLHGGDDDAAG